MASAFGRYHGESAGAVGLFYRPTDAVMINVRGTVGSDQNMVGAGVSMNLDKGDKTGVSKAQLVKTVQQQNNVIAEQNERIAKLEAVVRELVKSK